VPKNTPSTPESGAVPPQVRTAPIQERSAARIDALLDAAAAVVDEVGFDRLTTAMVAERASASIGTVYRYFPDRIVLLQALRNRAVGRYRDAIVAMLEADRPSDWLDGVVGSVDVFAGMFRTEPGFRIIRFASAERDPAEADDTRIGFFARQMVEIFEGRYSLPSDDDFPFRIEITIELVDALVNRAFLVRADGDERFIEEARVVVREYLGARYGTTDS